MIASNDRYSIRSDYRPNKIQNTFDTSEDPSYWNDQRLESAASYQYDVYTLAAELVSEKAVSRLLDVGSGPPIKLRELMPAGLDIYLVNQ